MAGFVQDLFSVFSYTHDLSDSHCLPGPDCLFQPVLLLLLLTGAYKLISFIVVPQATQLQVHVAGGGVGDLWRKGRALPTLRALCFINEIKFWFHCCSKLEP